MTVHSAELEPAAATPEPAGERVFAERLTARLRTRCIVAVALMTVITAAFFASSWALARSSRVEVGIIEQLARQRMLISQVCLWSERLADGAPDRRAAARRELDKLVESLRTGHDGLAGIVGQASTGRPDQLDEKMEGFFAAVRELQALPDEQLRDQHPSILRVRAASETGGLLDAQNEFVIALTDNASRAQRRLETLAVVRFGAMIAAIALVALWVFRPMIHRVRLETRQLEGANARLDQRGQDLARALEELQGQRDERRDRMLAMASILDDLRMERAKLEAEVEGRKEAEREVQRINDELRKKNEEMQQFVYTVSHDLKSPLVTCRGYVGIMKQYAEEERWPDVCSAMGRVELAADRMTELIEDLLQLSRIGVIRNEPEEVEVGGLVEELVGSLRGRLADIGAEVVLEPDLPVVMADRVRLREVFENLIGNALKYGCDGEDRRIQIGGHRADSEVRYFVRDHGKGIEAEFHQKVFELFQRLQADGEGTGVGLAAVARIMEVQGGRAWVESEPGRGATFWIAVPDRKERHSKDTAATP